MTDTQNADGLRNSILNLIPDIDVIPLDRAFGLLREIRAVCLATPSSSNGAEGDPCPYCKHEMHGADDCEKCGCGSPGRPTKSAPQLTPDTTEPDCGWPAKVAMLLPPSPALQRGR